MKYIIFILIFLFSVTLYAFQIDGGHVGLTVGGSSGGINIPQRKHVDYTGTYWAEARTDYWTDTREALWDTARNTEVPE